MKCKRCGYDKDKPLDEQGIMLMCDHCVYGEPPTCTKKNKNENDTKEKSSFISYLLKNFWIKCSDKHPENNQYVLCYDGNDIDIFKFTYYENKKKYNFTNSQDDFFYATHWMPLPAPPLEKDDHSTS